MTVPSDLTRSFLTILVPGVVALSPWVLLLIWNTSAGASLKDYPALANIFFFAAVSVVGSVCNGFGTLVESFILDECRNQKYEVDEYWFRYLSHVPGKEPVGFRFLSRLAGVLSFELAMFWASFPFVIGSAVLTDQLFPHLGGRLVYGVAALLVIVLPSFFFCMAAITHHALATTRREVLQRIERACAAVVAPGSPQQPGSAPTPSGGDSGPAQSGHEPG